MTSKPAPFMWYDLMTNDMKSATKFYADVVGWKIEDSGMPGQSYSILKVGDAMVGGLMAIPPGGAEGGLTPMWTGYIYSADVDADTKRAVKLGAKMCREPTDIPQVGRFSVIADPHGAMFNLFKPNGQQGPGEAPRDAAGQIGWRELSAGNGEEAWTFYSKMFGWTKSTAMPMGPLGVYQIFKTTGAEDVGAIMTKNPHTPNAAWTFYFNVPALDAAMARVTKGGGKLCTEAMAVPGGQWVVNAADPQGAPFAMVAPKR